MRRSPRSCCPGPAERPISLVRCPQGRAKKCFFQKHDAGSFGDSVHHVAIREKDGTRSPISIIDNADGLLTCVQMGTIEFHGWGARIEDVEKADRLVFDLDPDEGLDFEAVRAAAFHFRDILEPIGLETFPMVTGGKGVHVIAPLTPQAEWPEVKDFALRFAQAVAADRSRPLHRRAVQGQARRQIFVDYLRNQRGATAVMPYSVRARPNAPVAVPISWEEMRDIDKPAHWHVGDAKALVKRAASKALRGWGRADQTLPESEGDPMHIATYNVNGVNGRLPVLLRWLKEDAARHRLSSGAEGAAGEVSRDADPRRSATTRSGMGRRAGTASRSWRAVPSPSRPSAGCRAIPTISHSRYIEAAVGELIVGCLYLPNGNPRAGAEVRLQARLVRAPDRARAQAAQIRRARGPLRRLQRHADRSRCLQARALGRRCCVLPGNARAYRRLVAQGWTDALRKIASRRDRSTPFGIISGMPSAAMPACASIICC